MRLLAATLLLLPLLIGCGPSSAEMTVTGKVTYNGKAIPDGDILFEPTDGKGIDAHSKIIDGSYTLRTLPGSKRVKIIATREEGARDPAMGMVPRKPYIPAKYNTTTELKRDVSTDPAQNHFEFTLEGPP